MSGEETLCIKDGTIGRLYRLHCTNESYYDREPVYVYQADNNGRAIAHSIVCEDEVLLLLDVTSMDPVLVMLTDGTTGYINQYVEVIEYVTQ